MRTLFENEFCSIIDNGINWVRKDKVLNTEINVTSYFNEEGNLIKKRVI